MSGAEPERHTRAQQERGDDVGGVEDGRVSDGSRHHGSERHPASHERPDPQRGSAHAGGEHHKRAELADADLGAADIADRVGVAGEHAVEQQRLGGAGDQFRHHLEGDPTRRGVLQPAARSRHEPGDEEPNGTQENGEQSSLHRQRSTARTGMGS